MWAWPPIVEPSFLDEYLSGLDVKTGFYLLSRSSNVIGWQIYLFYFFRFVFGLGAENPIIHWQRSGQDETSDDKLKEKDSCHEISRIQELKNYSEELDFDKKLQEKEKYFGT